MKRFKWTKQRKKAAREALLAIANQYETKRRKTLRGVVFLNDGRAKWNGHAHDYSVDMSIKKLK